MAIRKIYSTETQFLTLQVLNSHGLDSDGLVVPLDQDGDDEAFSSRGLKRLVLVCLTIPAWGIHLKRLYPFNSPVSVSGFLVQQWSDAEGVFALPQTIEMSKACALCDAGLVDWLKSVGVEVVFGSEINKKSLAAFERAVKAIYWEITFGNEKGHSAVVTLECANASFEYHSRFGVTIFQAHNFSSATEQFESFQVRLRRRLDSSAIPVSGSDINLESLQVRKVSRAAPELRFDREAAYSEQDEACIDDLKSMLACWPVSQDAMRNWTGIKAQELSWLFARKAALDRKKLYRLYEYLYVDASGDYPDFMGGNIFIAKGRGNIDAVVNSLTHGGDQRAFFEISNSDAISDRWRIALLWGWSGLPAAILFERGSQEAKRLDGKHWPQSEKWFYNFQGQREVRRSLVNDMQWALEHLDQLDGFGRFGTFLHGKHGKYLYTPEFENDR